MLGFQKAAKSFEVWEDVFHILYTTSHASLIACFELLQLREYIDDTEDYINIQVINKKTSNLLFQTIGPCSNIIWSE